MSRPRPHVRPPAADAALVWLRRDLRLTDHAALYYALAAHRRVWCCFVFDRSILEPLPRADRRVEFIWKSLQELDQRLRQYGSRLIVLHGDPVHEIPALAQKLGVAAVTAARDYEPTAQARDDRVASALAQLSMKLFLYKDQALLDTDEVLTGAGKPFSVFTPYARAWLRQLDAEQLKAYPSEQGLDRLAPVPDGLGEMPTLEQLGFTPTNLADLSITPGESGAQLLLDNFVPRMPRYAEQRDFPAVRGVSYLSVHNRFGTISVRELARRAQAVAALNPGDGAARWLSELAWRDFYFQILYHHPRVVTEAFKREYDRIEWDDRPDLLAAWQEGRTGYPLVDAAMRQLARTGFMHNRLRMVVASFLSKDLGLDWRLGEAWFALHLNDFDLSANNGGWQWAASSGCDAQPYFRIFNPVSQSEKFDPEGHFIRRYVPELAALPTRFIHAPWLAPLAAQQHGIRLGIDYPYPVVDHAQARERTLARYAVIKSA